MMKLPEKGYLKDFFTVDWDEVDRLFNERIEKLTEEFMQSRK